jgi:molybdopterin biosynthesis enzyme
MLPAGADAALMLEYTQTLGDEIEIMKSVADGENLIRSARMWPRDSWSSRAARACARPKSAA